MHEKVSVETLLKRPHPAPPKNGRMVIYKFWGHSRRLEEGAGPTQMVVTVTMDKGIRRKGCMQARTQEKGGGGRIPPLKIAKMIFKKYIYIVRGFSGSENLIMMLLVSITGLLGAVMLAILAK